MSHTIIDLNFWSQNNEKYCTVISLLIKGTFGDPQGMPETIENSTVIGSGFPSSDSLMVNINSHIMYKIATIKYGHYNNVK